MVTKKRYVGIAYEDEPPPRRRSGAETKRAVAATASALTTQRSHEIDGVFGKWMAKGIETVRRDQCPATQKVLESSLRTLFLTKDLALVKANVQAQLRKILSDRCPLSDYIFRKRVRRDYRSPPPAKWVANAREMEDVGWKPQYNEIVPCVPVRSPRFTRIVDATTRGARLVY
jgi:DNA polymerase elongation subunit (family B)